MSYGLLGRTLGHSFSPQIHSQIGDYRYELFEREPEEVDAFCKEGTWKGINVTIPYKETVMPYCARIEDKAQRIGCVNTLVREADGTISGYNTDYDGFSYSLDMAGMEISGRKCLILGNGATSKTIATVLADKGAREILNIGRHDAIPYSDIHLHYDAEVIVNATPVGMYPNTPNRLIELGGFEKLESVFDVIYNPHRTQLLLDAQDRGVRTCDGLPMLVAQAVYAANHFLGLDDIESHIQPILQKMRVNADNIVLIGMPGVGKTTVGKLVAEKSQRPFVDVDVEIEKKIGSISTYITEQGEAAFRKVESETLAEIGKEHGLVISTGGGVITVPSNHDLLRQNGRIYWRERPVEDLSTHGRPLSAGGLDTLKGLYQTRKPMYEAFADVRIEGLEIEETAELIMEDFNEAMRH